MKELVPKPAQSEVPFDTEGFFRCHAAQAHDNTCVVLHKDPASPSPVLHVYSHEERIQRPSGKKVAIHFAVRLGELIAQIDRDHPVGAFPRIADDLTKAERYLATHSTRQWSGISVSVNGVARIERGMRQVERLYERRRVESAAVELRATAKALLVEAIIFWSGVRLRNLTPAYIDDMIQGAQE